MPHVVKCQFCGESFDRDKFSYVEVGYHRYGHAKCYLAEKEKNPQITERTVISPDEIVTCCFCKKEIHKSRDSFKKIGNKYAHTACAELDEKREKTDQEKLDIYICKLFHLDYVTPRIRKQINNYVAEYSYTYTGIQRSLYYFYELKKNDISKANDGIGIVPYIYKDAYNYFYSLWLAEQKNKDKVISNYVPKVVEVTILNPQRDIDKGKNHFGFLDEDVKGG